MSAPKLTEAQVLRVMSDWSSAWEMAECLGHKEITSHFLRALFKVLDGLCADGRAEYGRANNAYRQTASGRAYLATLDRERDDAMTTHPDSDRRG
jgi:hypothetical protein